MGAGGEDGPFRGDFGVESSKALEAALGKVAAGCPPRGGAGGGSSVTESQGGRAGDTGLGRAEDALGLGLAGLGLGSSGESNRRWEGDLRVGLSGGAGATTERFGGAGSGPRVRSRGRGLS